MAYTVPVTRHTPVERRPPRRAGVAEDPGDVRGARSERRRAFEAEVLPHLDAAYRLARALTGHGQDAEDLAQEALLRAFAGFTSYRPGTNARAWLLTILRRIYLNDRRRARARPLLVPMHDGDAVEEPLAPADAWTSEPEEQALRALDQAAMLAALAELPAAFRAVVTLVDLEGMRYAEVADVLDCPIGTVMSRLHRARLQLARRLREAAPEPRARQAGRERVGRG